MISEPREGAHPGWTARRQSLPRKRGGQVLRHLSICACTAIPVIATGLIGAALSLSFLFTIAELPGVVPVVAHQESDR